MHTVDRRQLAKILGTFSGCLLFPGSTRLPLISRIIYCGRHGEVIPCAIEKESKVECRIIYKEILVIDVGINLGDTDCTIDLRQNTSLGFL